MDHVDKIVEQWRNQRPDIDTAPMALIGRLQRISMHLASGMSKNFAKYDLNGASFDVLATLRRSGAPYALSPGDLMASAMITSGTMTNRIDQLEKRGLVARAPNPEDGRGFLVSLTDGGFALVDEVVTSHVGTQANLAKKLNDEERTALNVLLAKFLKGFE
ncbi:MAG: MarR family transcriptional regulator [Hyphomicrobiales bacterium]